MQNPERGNPRARSAPSQTSQSYTQILQRFPLLFALRVSNHNRYLILALLALASALIGLAVSWTSFGQQFDKYAYDFLFRLEPPAPWQPSSIILAIDEPTIVKYTYPAGIRAALADGLDKIQP